jgi:formylglycine-generating enzyme required for sulfatase activity
MNDTHSVQDDAQSLRDQLAELRAEAEGELMQLRLGLARVRELAHPARDADRAAEGVAAWQEVESLRRSLREKERLVDATAAQCRRLEDELEDHHRAYDGLKQNLERAKLMLVEVRERAAKQGRARTPSEAQTTTGAALSAEPPAVRRLSPSPTGFLGDRRFLAGVMSGMIAVAIAAGGLLGMKPGVLSSGSAPASAGRETAAPPASVAQSQPQAVEVAAVAAGSKGKTLLFETRTVSDRLQGGGAAPLMLVLSEATFTMGQPRTLPTDDEGPAHQVHVRPFLIGATEVTFDDYDRFAHATGARLPRDFGWGRGRRPVVDVSWLDAQAYARWLSEQTGKGYRLPSEAEWEYAARAGQPSAFWWGYRKGEGRAACFDCGGAFDNRLTRPVGSFAPNPFGLYDTAGNAMEWVEDCYHATYVGAPTDGRPWESPDCPNRVARGGAFNKPAEAMRGTARHRFAPDTRINMLGFRVARDE